MGRVAIVYSYLLHTCLAVHGSVHMYVYVPACYFHLFTCRQTITMVLGVELHFSFYHRWFDVIFLVSFVPSMLVIYNRNMCLTICLYYTWHSGKRNLRI